MVRGTVRTLTDFGAFVDIGGVDGLLHVADMAWHRVAKPSDVVSPGDILELKILKVNAQTQADFAGPEAAAAGPMDRGG